MIIRLPDGEFVDITATDTLVHKINELVDEVNRLRMAVEMLDKVRLQEQKQ